MGLARRVAVMEGLCARRRSPKRAVLMGALSAIVVLLLLAPGVPAGAQSTDVPSPPEGLSVTSVTHDSVTLSWTPPSDASVTGYQVLRRDHADGITSAYAVIADDLGSDTTSYADTGVLASSSYSYRVKARNAAGLSASSRHVRADTPAAPAPVTYSTTPVAQVFSKSDPGPNSPQPKSPPPLGQGLTQKDDGQSGQENKDPADESKQQRSDHDSPQQDPTPPSQPTSSASTPDPDPPEETDTEPETQPPPTRKQLMERFTVRVAPPPGD